MPIAKVAEAPKKKESVVEHLAEVIKEARKNNQTEKSNTITTPAETTVEKPKKKRRRRKRKPKPQTQPVRQNTQVNTTSKSEPVKLIKKDQQNEGETSFDDLSGGGEIEINLD